MNNKFKRLILIILIMFFSLFGRSVSAESVLDYELIENHYATFTLSSIGRLFYLKIFLGKIKLLTKLNTIHL